MPQVVINQQVSISGVSGSQKNYEQHDTFIFSDNFDGGAIGDCRGECTPYDEAFMSYSDRKSGQSEGELQGSITWLASDMETELGTVELNFSVDDWII